MWAFFLKDGYVPIVQGKFNVGARRGQFQGLSAALRSAPAIWGAATFRVAAAGWRSIFVWAKFGGDSVFFRGDIYHTSLPQSRLELSTGFHPFVKGGENLWITPLV